jgi:RNA polymerase sigma-70 factor (sigma-E family)
MSGTKGRRDEEFSAFMAEASPSLLRTAWLLTGDPHAAQELVQAALVKTYAAWSRVQRDQAQAYARRVLVNHSTDTWRSRRRETLVDDLPEPTTAHPRAAAIAAPESLELRQQVVTLLQRLPAQQRRVVVLRYYVDQSEQSVADTLGISVGAVKSAASRGLAAIRADLEASRPSDQPAPAPAAATTPERSLR